MPLYGSSTPTTHNAGYPSPVWTNETLTLPANGKSLAICMRRQANMANMLSCEIQFSASPGAFQIDLEVADTDNDAFYVMKQSVTALASGNVARIELSNVVAKFARLRMVTRTNSVAVSAKFF